MENRPFTMNTHYLSDYRAKFLAYYKGSRQLNEHSDVMKVIQGFSSSSNQAMIARGFQNGGPYATQPTGIAKAIAGLAEIGMIIKPEDLPKLLPPDKMEPALGIMADVRAYFQGMFIFFPRCINTFWLTSVAFFFGSKFSRI